MNRAPLGRRRFLLGAAGSSAALIHGWSAVSARADDWLDDPQPVPSVVAPPLVAPLAPAEVIVGHTPARVIIPVLGVNSIVVPVGLDPDGAMGAPLDPDTVGWYANGPGMGIAANVPLAGHVDWLGVPKVFAGLSRLGDMDVVQVQDVAGNIYDYYVVSSRWFRAEGAPVEEIYSQEVDRPTITLITCGGEFVWATREYLDRIVVQARMA
jgi:sortase (surface protein transpeptidase)